MKNKKMPIHLSTWLFAIYLFFSPLDMILNIFGTGTILKYLGILIITTFILEYIVSKSKIKINMIACLVIIYCLLYLFTSMWPYYVSVFPYSIINLALFYLLLTSKPYTYIEYKKLLIGSILGALVLSIYMIMNSNTLLYLDRVTIGMQGQYIDPNDMGANLIMPIFLCIEYMKLKRKNLLSTIICTSVILMVSYAILLTGSRGALLALIVGFFTYIFSNAKVSPVKKAIYIIIATFVCIFFYFAVVNYLPEVVKSRITLNKIIEDKGSSRLMIWGDAIKIYSDSSIFRLLFGYGFSNFRYLHLHYNGIFNGTHNLFMQNLLEGGIVGLILIILILVSNGKKAISKDNNVILSILIATVVISFFLETVNKKFFWNALIFASMQIIDNCTEKNVKNRNM